MEESRTATTIRGLKWTSASTVTNAALQIGFTAVMARLLDPAAFGQVAMAGVILSFGSYFAGMGVGAALIQKEEVSQNEIEAAFSSTLFLGLFFSTLVWIFAPLSLLVFNNPSVVPIVRMMGLTLVFSGLSIPSVSLLRRSLDFRSLAIAETTAFAVGAGGVGITMALLGFGLWSLVASAIAQSVLLAILAFAFCRFRLRISFKWSTLKALYSYGGKFSVISFLEFATYNMDSVLIGNMLGSRLLGIYNRASLLINLPAQYINQSLMKVLFPSFSRMQSDIERMRSVYVSTLLFLGIGLFSISFGISAGAQDIVVVVLGRQWIEAIPVLRILALAVPFHLLLHFNGLICDTTGRLNIKMVVRGSHVIVFAFLYFLLSGQGLIGFASVLLIGELLFYVAYTIVALNILKISWRDVVGVHMYSLVGGIVCMLPIFSVSLVLNKLALFSVVILLCEITVGAIALFSYVFFFPPKILRIEVEKRFFRGQLFDSRTGPIQTFLSWYRRSLLEKANTI